MTLALLVDSAIRALLLGAAAWLAMRALRVRNPHVEKFVGRSVLLAALVLPALLYWRLAPVLGIPVPWLLTIVGGATPGAPSALFTSSVSILTAFTSIYIAVATILLGRFLSGVVRMARLRWAAQPLPNQSGIRLSDRILSPVTFGSTILLPVAAHSWSASQLDAVLVHERAHVRFRDCHWLWLLHLHGIIFWFSPLSWWLRRRFAALAEATSDDAVLASDHDPIAYAELLLEFARQPNPGRVAMSASGPKVSDRVERILSRLPPSAPPRRIARIIAAVLLIPATVLAAASATTAATPADYEALDDQNAPHIVDFGDLAKLGDHYPPLAVQDHVSGMVTLGATLDSEGHVIAVTVLKEDPADPRYGFGAAAMDVARTVRFENPAKAGVLVKFQVKFVLDQ
jgi:TonB family protein